MGSGVREGPSVSLHPLPRRNDGARAVPARTNLAARMKGQGRCQPSRSRRRIPNRRDRRRSRRDRSRASDRAGQPSRRSDRRRGRQGCAASWRWMRATKISVAATKISVAAMRRICTLARKARPPVTAFETGHGWFAPLHDHPRRVAQSSVTGCRSTSPNDGAGF
jgi:hypothetical protein